VSLPGDARAWIASQVVVTGEIRQVHAKPWSTVWRVPTAREAVWFKAPASEFAYEAAVLEVLLPLAPDLLPEVVALSPDTGWLLLADAGDRAREHPPNWAPVLRRYAELQIAAAPVAGDLLAAGAIDHRDLPSRVRRLVPFLHEETRAKLEPRLPEVDERLARLAASPLAATIDHNDLHDGNVFVRDQHARVLDWGDSTVGHPFLSLVEMVPAGRAAYLELFSGLAPVDRLAQDAEDVLALRPLLQALTEDRVARADPSFDGIDELVAELL
jgi:Phosphotransferase enzyme family